MDTGREQGDETRYNSPEPGPESSSALEQNPQPEPDDDTPTVADMALFHFFGRPGRLRATKSFRHSRMSGNHRPFKEPVQLPWKIDLGQADLARLLHGFTPDIMEDKWFIYAEGPDSTGAARVHFLRSWTMAIVAVLDVEVSLVSADTVSAWTGQIVQITMEKEVELDIRMHMATCEEQEVLSGLVVTSPPEADRFKPGDGDTVEDHIKFQVLMVCRNVLRIDIGEIKRPKAWELLSQIPARPPYVCYGSQQTYRGVGLSKQTEEDIERLGGMEEMFRKTSIQFTNG
jgi:hypothetical protein